MALHSYEAQTSRPDDYVEGEQQTASMFYVGEALKVDRLSRVSGPPSPENEALSQLVRNRASDAPDNLAISPDSEVEHDARGDLVLCLSRAANYFAMAPGEGGPGTDILLDAAPIDSPVTATVAREMEAIFGAQPQATDAPSFATLIDGVELCYRRGQQDGQEMVQIALRRTAGAAETGTRQPAQAGSAEPVMNLRVQGRGANAVASGSIASADTQTNAQRRATVASGYIGDADTTTAAGEKLVAPPMQKPDDEISRDEALVAHARGKHARRAEALDQSTGAYLLDLAGQIERVAGDEDKPSYALNVLTERLRARAKDATGPLTTSGNENEALIGVSDAMRRAAVFIAPRQWLPKPQPARLYSREIPRMDDTARAVSEQLEAVLGATGGTRGRVNSGGHRLATVTMATSFDGVEMHYVQVPRDKKQGTPARFEIWLVRSDKQAEAA